MSNLAATTASIVAPALFALLRGQRRGVAIVVVSRAIAIVVVVVVIAVVNRAVDVADLAMNIVDLDSDVVNLYCVGVGSGSREGKSFGANRCLVRVEDAAKLFSGLEELRHINSVGSSIDNDDFQHLSKLL